MNKDALEKCFLPYIMSIILANVFDWSYLKFTSLDHISSKYQLMFLVFEVSYHYHCSSQNVSFSLMEKLNSGRPNIFCEKVLKPHDSCYRPASGMTFLNDIYLRLKRTEHKWGTRYFVISAKACWCHRLEVLLFKI